MRAREEVLSQIVALAGEHGLSSDDIAEAMRAAAPQKARASIAMRLFSYLGGIFVFAGIAAYIGMFWHDMNSAMRVIITLGSGFAVFLMGVAASRDPRYSKAVPPLLLIAALLQPGGLFVAIDEYFHTGNDPRYAELFVFGVMLLQQGFAFQALRQAILLCSTIGFACLFFGTAFDLLHVDGKWIGSIIGLSLLYISYGLDKTPYRPIVGFWYLIGSVSFLCGAFAVLQHTPVELLYLAITCFMVYVSVLAQSTTLLVVGVLAMLSYIGYFTEEHFVHSVGWPVALIMLGLAFFGVSAGAVKIKKKYL